ncbi:MAG: outer membrane protein assembly factor BamC [bacterium]
MIHFRVFAVVAFALSLLSCSSAGKQEEANQGKDSRDEDSLFSITQPSRARTALEVPPDLLDSATQKVRDNATARANANASGERVLPEVVGATIQKDAERSWLEVDAEAEAVWRKLVEFWAYEGIDLVEYRPESGVMETDWFVKSAKKPQSKGVGTVAVELFDAFTSRRTALDKFTLRLERNGDATYVFVSHRAREKIAKEYANKLKSTEYEWVERDEDAEKVAQLLQTIVLLFAGAEADGRNPA